MCEIDPTEWFPSDEDAPTPSGRSPSVLAGPEDVRDIQMAPSTVMSTSLGAGIATLLTMPVFFWMVRIPYGGLTGSQLWIIIELTSSLNIWIYAFCCLPAAWFIIKHEYRTLPDATTGSPTSLPAPDTLAHVFAKLRQSETPIEQVLLRPLRPRAPTRNSFGHEPFSEVILLEGPVVESDPTQHREERVRLPKKKSMVRMQSEKSEKSGRSDISREAPAAVGVWVGQEVTYT
ncbi:hypothetical protein RQP46_005843 [Phenoliferia psychrophenolica]